MVYFIVHMVVGPPYVRGYAISYTYIRYCKYLVYVYGMDNL